MTNVEKLARHLGYRHAPDRLTAVFISLPFQELYHPRVSADAFAAEIASRLDQSSRAEETRKKGK